METLNEIYFNLLKELWHNGEEVSPRGMKCKELINKSILIRNSKDNIITIPEMKTNLKYAEEEFRWYIAATNKIDWSPLIKKIWTKFSDNGETVNSNYGYRIFGNDSKVAINQWNFVKSELKRDQFSRRAVININMPHDKYSEKDMPCTLTFQILKRNNKLHWITTMRSQDIFLGWRNDIYCFTRLQELLSNELKTEIGQYAHNVGSLHLYEKDYEKVKIVLGVK